MSSTSSSPYPAAQGREATGPGGGNYDDESVGGWVMFAGVMLIVIGILNVIYGIAAIDAANFYVHDARYVISDLSTWGWIATILGAVQVVAAGGLLVSAAPWGRWVGIVSAGANGIGQLLWISSYPWLSVALFAVDVLVLYGLVAHGGRRR